MDRLRKEVVATMCLLASLAVVVLIGCGERQPAVSDAEEATNLTKQMLDAWMAGETLDEQRNKQPPVFVADDLWKDGAKLESYEINGPGTVFGTNVRVDVTLTYKPTEGRSRQQRVFYLVTTIPERTMARED